MIFISEDGNSKIDLKFYNDVLSVEFYAGKDDKNPLALIRTRGQESNEIIAFLKKQP